MPGSRYRSPIVLVLTLLSGGVTSGKWRSRSSRKQNHLPLVDQTVTTRANAVAGPTRAAVLPGNGVADDAYSVRPRLMAD